ncbi:MAG: protein kinase [Pyrinomonadaceae bacterium]
MEAEKSKTCTECGSSVVEAEAFCPYCGIRLESPTAEDASSDESLDSTVMMSAADSAALAGAVGAQATPPKESDAPPAQGEDVTPQDTGETETAAGPTHGGPLAADDVPVPSLLTDFGKTGNNITPSSTSEYSSRELSPGPVADLSVGEFDQTLLASPLASGTPAADVPEPGPAEAAEPQATQPEGSMIEAAEPQPAAPSAIDEIPIQDQPIEVPPPSSISSDVPEIESIADDGPAISEPEVEAAIIAKPEDDLSAYDSYESRSLFDSVRIMEPGTSDKADDVATQMHPEIRRANDPPVDAAEIAVPADVNPENALSSGSHNIGIGETDGKRSSKLKPLSEGTVLNGRYEIIRKIGGGGMGAVYLASDNNLGGVLRAVKEMVQTHIEEEQQEKAINDFKRESMILSSLDHVSIPTIYDYFYDDTESRFYLVMKYISGGDLSSRLRSASEGRVDERTVCEWALQITDVLDYLHNQPSTIVYRDLKPSNIMIDGNSGRAMLIDFGIARSISQKEEKGVTAVGTMGYAPPELFSGNVEPRSDIYSLGSTMFHLLTGADPQSNPLLIFDFQKNPRPRQINPQLSDQIERIIMKAVEYNGDQRFSSAADMRGVLEDHLLKLKAGIVTYGVGEVPTSVSLANQSVFCGFCGQGIVATDMFCAFCGAKQPIAQQGVHAEIYARPGMTAKLVVEGTSELTAPAFSLQKDDNLLGRRDPMSNIFPEIDLSKYDPQTKISRRHARIWRDGSNFLLEDLGSSNGTMLTRATAESFRLMPNQPQMLAAGDRIRLGDATLHFIIG